MSSAAGAGRGVEAGPHVQGNDFYDALLEALSYLVDGAWGGFERTYEALDDEVGAGGLSARDAARVLSALGHIELQVDRRTMRPASWSISPPVLLRITAREWLLCGRRSDSLVAALSRAAERRGSRLKVERLPWQPVRIVLESAGDASSEQVEAIANDVGERSHDLSVNELGVAQLAHALPPLADVLAHLHRSVPAGGGAIERLAHGVRGRLTWSRTLDFASRGSYRFDPPPITYAFVDSNGAAPMRVDPRFARLLALLAEGAAPLAWDPATATATTVYYAEPPGLYERVLALSSGIAPQGSRHERVTRYRGVSEEIAVAVYSRLSMWDVSEDV